MEKANIIFMGTPEIAVPTLKKLNDKYNIQAVVTVPDKPKGRGLKLQYSPVKEAALELGLEVLQPIKMRDEDFVSAVKNYSPDIIVVFAFRILPDVVYKAAKQQVLIYIQVCCLNIEGLRQLIGQLLMVKKRQG